MSQNIAVIGNRELCRCWCEWVRGGGGGGRELATDNYGELNGVGGGRVGEGDGNSQQTPTVKSITMQARDGGGGGGGASAGAGEDSTMCGRRYWTALEAPASHRTPIAARVWWWLRFQESAESAFLRRALRPSHYWLGTRCPENKVPVVVEVRASTTPLASFMAASEALQSLEMGVATDHLLRRSRRSQH